MDRSSSVLITQRVAESAEPRGERYHLWDIELAGFGLRIEVSGAVTFVVRYRAGGGGRSAPRRFFTIGRYGTLTVKEARVQAKAVLGAVAKGDDPAGERSMRRRETTLSALIDLYEGEGCFVQRGIRQGLPMKERTKIYTLSRLRHHAVPLLGRKRVSEIDAGDIERFVRDVTTGKTASDKKLGPRKRVVVRGGEGAARKVVRDLSAIFSFAVRRGITDSNPVQKAAIRKTDNRRERYLSLEELARLGRTFDELAREEANAKGIAIARLLALTGCRRDEIAGLRWSEVDLKRGLLILNESKTGKSVRPLGLAAIKLLRRIGKSDESDYVFPAESGPGHYQGMNKLWPSIVEKAKLPGVTPHTLRHTVGSTAVSSGEALMMAGAILGHANPRSTTIYAHIQMDPSKRSADRVANIIAAALAGKISAFG